MPDALLPLALGLLHQDLNARMVPFAGYEMPVQYEAGVMAEHLHTRTKAGLFDVSHMGQILVKGRGSAAALERLMPMSVLDLAEGRQRYGLLTLPSGGVADDLMFANRGDDLFLVVNGAMKHQDLQMLAAGLPDQTVHLLSDRALLALQGPQAEDVLAALVPATSQMRFMDVIAVTWNGADLWISRSGYTGEDGFEISVPNGMADIFARTLLSDARVLPIGLGARDSLRLEAGMPLYGQDLSPQTTPVEAGLAWAIQKVRRSGGAREAQFPGADRILAELDHGAQRRRVGLRPEGRAPMRAGVRLFDSATSETPIGAVTSGGFGPSLVVPIAMGYVAAPVPSDAPLWGEVRGKRLPVSQTSLPFYAPQYKR